MICLAIMICIDAQEDDWFFITKDKVTVYLGNISEGNRRNTIKILRKYFA